MKDQHQHQPPPHTTPTINTDQNTNLYNNLASVSSHDHNHYQKIDQFISILNNKDQSAASSPPQLIEPIHHFADHFDVILVAYESGSKKWTDLMDDNSFCLFESIDRAFNIIKALSRFHSDQNYIVSINSLSSIHHRAISILEVEFKSILDDYQTSYDRDQNINVEDVSKFELPDPEQSETQLEKDQFLGYSNEMLSNLIKLVNGLIKGGHETECTELYFFVRRNAMEQNLKDLEFEKFSTDDLQKMQWDQMEKEICSWINIFQRFCSSLLPSERKLADAVFSSHTAISNRVFGDLTRNIVSYFLSFAEGVMLTKRSGDKLFKFLDMYEMLRDNVPTVEKLISSEWLDQLKASVLLIRHILGESIFMIFIELENAIKSDTTKTPVPGGAVHPLTSYVMNYLKSACEYSDTLEQVFKDHRKMDRAGSITDRAGSEYPKSHEHQHNYESNEVGLRYESSPFQAQLVKIMDLLEANLEAKSRLYKDPSLSLIFMMNNGRYILQKTKGTGEMRTLLGDPWVRKQSSDLHNYHTCYKRETWTKLLQCLNHEGLNVNGKVMKPVLKERFKSFNAMFDEIYKTQTTWVVSDEQLQSELRVSISAIVTPAYRSFMGRFSQVFTPGRQTEKYIKYQPEDIERCIEELFDGNATQQGKKR